MKYVMTLVAIVCLALGAAGVQAADVKTSNTQVAAAAVEKVNINTADVEALAANLQHIGVKKAEAIVDYRNNIGKFTAVEQLLDVKGIGEATLEANKDKIVF